MHQRVVAAGHQAQAGGQPGLDRGAVDGESALLLRLHQQHERGLVRQRLRRGHRRPAQRRVLLAGMRAIRNSEPDYLRGFEGIYPELAAKYRVPLYPFFLDGVALVEGMSLPDGLHPNFRGLKVIVTRMSGPVQAALGR